VLVKDENQNDGFNDKNIENEDFSIFNQIQIEF
jgi:hypothetical protein